MEQTDHNQTSYPHTKNKSEAEPSAASGRALRPVLLYVITQASWEEPQKYIVELATAYREEYDIHVAFGTFEYTGRNIFREELEALGVSIHAIDSLGAKNIITHEVQTAVALWRLVRKLRPTLVHTNDAKSSLLIGLARVFNAPTTHIATLHSLRHESDIVKRERGLWRFMIKLSYGMAQTIITQSTHLYTQAVALFGKKYITQILPGLHEIDFVDATQKRRALTQSFDSSLAAKMRDEQTIVIGNIAPLEADEGLSFVLQAVSQLEEQGMKLVYIHYGEGSQRKLLEHEIKQFNLGDTVVLKGLDTLAYRYLPLFDFVVHPTLKPEVGELIRNAGLAQRALITSRVDGVSDMLTDGKEALLVEPKNAKALEQAIRELAAHPEKRRPMGLALEQAIRANFSSGDMIRETREVYQGKKQETAQVEM